MSSVLDSLIAAGNSFQMVGVEQLKERLLKLVVQEGIHKRFWLAECYIMLLISDFIQTNLFSYNSDSLVSF